MTRTVGVATLTEHSAGCCFEPPVDECPTLWTDGPGEPDCIPTLYDPVCEEEGGFLWDEEENRCCRLTGEAGAGVWCEHIAGASFRVALASEGAIVMRRTDYPTPPLPDESPVTEPGEGQEDREPCFSRNRATQDLILLFTREDGGSDVWETRSTDDGVTWSEPEMAFEGASHPHIRHDRHGYCVRAAYKDGGIVATVQAQGDDEPSDEFPFEDESGPIGVADDNFCLSPGPTASSPWELVAFATDGTFSAWVSYDDCLTWESQTP